MRKKYIKNWGFRDLVTSVLKGIHQRSTKKGIAPLSMKKRLSARDAYHPLELGTEGLNCKCHLSDLR